MAIGIFAFWPQDEELGRVAVFISHIVTTLGSVVKTLLSVE